jgi:uncharacterized protein with LGFP repeats
MDRLPRARTLALAALLAVALAVVPVPALSLSAPKTLAVERTLGQVEGPSEVADPRFPVDHLGISWLGDRRPEVRFRTGGNWGPWIEPEEDEIPTVDGRTWSTLVPAVGAGAYQLRGHAEGVRAVAINSTDGPRSLVWETPDAQASHILQPPVISRAAWGANESYRFKADGTEKGTRTFYSTRKLIIHHTVTANDDPDPAATVRSIYYYHTVSRGFLDIAYNFLIDAQGNIYKGRYSGPQNTADQDTLTGENASGLGVTGAHTGGWNSGTMGVAILGEYTSVPIPDLARKALVEHLAWESERHLLDPLATTTFTNPASGDQKTAPNISGHRDWSATACPGELLYAQLPALRQEVAARVGALAAPDIKPPRISRVDTKQPTRRFVIFTWRTSEPATGQVRFWEPRRSRRTTPLVGSLQKRHKARVRGLPKDRAFRYVVMSRDAAGNFSKSRIKGFDTFG